MASVFTPFDNYKTGAGMNYPVVIKSPYDDWRSLLIRCKVKTASELFIGALVEQADSGTAFIVEKTADKSSVVLGIIPDTVENKAQLEIDNSGAKATKALFFAANSYVWVLPLIPGMILSVRVTASVCAIDAGSLLCSDVNGAVRLQLGIASDAEPKVTIGRALAQNTNGTGVQYIPMMVK